MSVGCTPDPFQAINPSVCDNNGNIEDDCIQVKTPPPPPPPKTLQALRPVD